MMTRFHMQASFDLVRAIERLLIAGKLDDARRLAGSLAVEADTPGLEPWSKQVALVRMRAAAVASASTIDAACRLEARLDEACAQCHVDASAEPEFASVPRVPADDPSVPARMARHRWAVDRLWEGMVGNSDEPWRSGLDVLAATPLPPSALGANRVDLGRELQRLADEARHAVTGGLEERGRRYGEILVACAACHTAPAVPGPRRP